MAEIPKQFLQREFNRSLGSLESLRITAGKQLLHGGMKGKTHKGIEFESAWSTLVRDIQGVISDANDSITDNNELRVICRHVKQAVDVFCSQFEVKRSQSAVKLLRRGVRNELRRVQGLIDEQFELSGTSQQAEDELVEDTTKEEDGEITADKSVDGESKGVISFPEDLETSIEFIVIQLEALLFDILGTFIKRLKDNLKYEDEILNTDSFRYLNFFIGSLGKLSIDVESFVREKGLSLGLEEFKGFLIEKINNAKPSRNAEIYGENYKENPCVVLIEEYFGRLIERIKQFSDAREFNAFILNSNCKALSEMGFSADILFFPQKLQHIQIRDAVSNRDDESGNDQIFLLSGQERQAVNEAWIKERSDRSDSFNYAVRKKIAQELNDRFHGGLPFRTAGDVKRIIDDIRTKDIGLDNQQREESKRMQEWHSSLLKHAGADYLKRLANKAAALARGKLEESQQVARGAVVIFDQQFLQDFLKVIEDIKRFIVAYIDSCSVDDYVSFRKLFSAEGTSVNLEASSIECEWRKALDSINLSAEDTAQLKQVAVDCNFVLERIGKCSETESDLLSLKDYDTDLVVKTILFGHLFSSINEGYKGAIMPAELKFLTSCCKLVEISSEDTVDSLLVKCESNGTIASWLNEMNIHLYGGIAIRRLETVREFVREIFVNIVTEKRKEERVAKQRIIPELQVRIDNVRGWVRGLENAPGRLYKTMLLALDRKLEPECVASQPVYVTEHFVRCLEFCKERCDVDMKSGKPYLKSNLGLDDMAVLFDVPTFPSLGYEELDKLRSRLEEIDRSISELKEKLARGGQKEVLLRNKRTQRNGLETTIEACKGDIRESISAMAKCYAQAAELATAFSDGKYDESKMLPVEAEIERLKQCKSTLDGILGRKQRELDTLNIEICQLEIEVAQGDPKTRAELDDLYSLKEKLLKDLAILFDSSYSLTTS